MSAGGDIRDLAACTVTLYQRTLPQNQVMRRSIQLEDDCKKNKTILFRLQQNIVKKEYLASNMFTGIQLRIYHAQRPHGEPLIFSLFVYKEIFDNVSVDGIIFPLSRKLFHYCLRPEYFLRGFEHLENIFASHFCVSIGSRNAFLPFHAKPCLEPMLTFDTQHIEELI